MANDNTVKVKITTEADTKGVKAIENEINKIEKDKVDVNVENTKAKQRIEELNALLKKIDDDPAHPNIDASKVKAEISNLKKQLGEVDDEPIKPKIDDSNVQLGIQNIKEGFASARQSAEEILSVMGDALESAGRMENMETFLGKNLGSADKAKSKLEEIRSVTDKLPGDDVTLQNLLSQAVVKDAGMTADAMTQMGQASADYMASMQNFGKSATETQQDLMNYLLAGNTAEIERSPILQSHVDKLKEGQTVQERSLLLQQALKEEGWDGISQADTYTNRQQKFNDMLERGKIKMGELFSAGANGGMEFLLQLDDASGGLVGMGVALGGLVGPVGEFMMSIGQIGTGLGTMKGLFGALPGVLSTVGGAFSSLFSFLIANPIVLVIIAIVGLILALIWAYNNVEWFHDAVDGLVSFLTGALTGAIDWITGLFNNFTQMLGLDTDNWIEALLGFILFFLTLPLQLAVGFANMIASALGFGDNFVQGLIQAGANSVNGFINWITQMYGMVKGEFDRILGLVTDFITNIPNMVFDLGASIVDSLKSALGIGSPGYMFYMLEGEFERMDDLTKSTEIDTTNIGSDMVSNFNPNLSGNVASGVNTGTNNITINIDSVDNEERINEIVKAVEDALKFDNLTAGRSV